MFTVDCLCLGVFDDGCSESHQPQYRYYSKWVFIFINLHIIRDSDKLCDLSIHKQRLCNHWETDFTEGHGKKKSPDHHGFTRISCTEPLSGIDILKHTHARSGNIQYYTNQQQEIIHNLSPNHTETLAHRQRYKSRDTSPTARTANNSNIVMHICTSDICSALGIRQVTCYVPL